MANFFGMAWSLFSSLGLSVTGEPTVAFLFSCIACAFSYRHGKRKGEMEALT